MSGAARQPARRLQRAPRAGRIHLPSVHIRSAEDSGYDYTEDLYLRTDRVPAVARVIELVAIERGAEMLRRRTCDELCAEEWDALLPDLPLLLDKGNPDALTLMEERARAEWERQLRIAARQEQACAACGCSETRACSGGCVWATKTLCSRCV